MAGYYDWNELMNYTPVEGNQGICPEGWHVPTNDEFMELINAVGGVQVAGQALKAGGSSGFNFPLGGSRASKGGFTVGALGENARQIALVELAVFDDAEVVLNGVGLKFQ